MSKFIIQGPTKISGRIRVSGAKNAALKMIAASLLTSDDVILKNVPRILDIETMLKIMERIGAKICWSDEQTLKINCREVKISAKLPNNLVQQLRASIVLVGPLLARFSKVKTAHPGGCVIGARGIETHLDAFRQMGVEVKNKNNQEYVFAAPRSKFFDRLRRPQNDKGGKFVKLKEASVTATENILLFAAGQAKKTVIKNAAREPEIVALGEMLEKMGCRIDGIGTTKITISGANKLAGGKFEIMGDRIEAGTFLIAGAVSGGKMTVEGINPAHLRVFLTKLKETGIKISKSKDAISIQPSHKLRATNISTAVHPGFPTDLQAPMGLLLTQSAGESKIIENLFSNRLGYLEELIKMGAKIKIIDNHRAKIIGGCKLQGTKIESLDLRAGATLLLASCIAQGKTELSPAETIDRGYESIDERLNEMGAKIKRI